MYRFIQQYWFLLSILGLLFIWMGYSYTESGIMHALIHNDSQEVITYLQSFGALAQIVFIGFVILEVVLAPIPPLILYVASGILFGSVYGGILVLIGNLIGASINFFVARRFLRHGIEARIDPTLRKKFDNYFARYGTLSIFLLRVNPLTSSDLVSYLAGFTNISLTRFLAATSTGLAPLVFLQTFLGESIIQGNPILTGITVIVSVVYLAIFIYLIGIALMHHFSHDKHQNN